MLQNVLCRKPLRKYRTPVDVQSHVFSSRDVKESWLFSLFLKSSIVDRLIWNLIHMLPGPLVYVKGQGHSEKSNLGCGDPSAVILSSSALIFSSSAVISSLCSIQCQYLVVNVCHCLYRWLTVRVRLLALMSVKGSVSSTFAKYPLCEWFHYVYFFSLNFKHIY